MATSAAPLRSRGRGRPERRLREHQRSARRGAGRSRPPAAARARGAARRRCARGRRDPERPEQQAERAERLERGDVGVLDAVEGRAARADVSRRRSRSRRGATRGGSASARRWPRGRRPGRSGSPRPAGTAWKWRSPVTSSPCSSPGRSAATTRTRTPVAPSGHLFAELAVQHVCERAGVGDHRDGPPWRPRALEQQPRVRALLVRLGQAALEGEAALAQEGGRRGDHGRASGRVEVQAARVVARAARGSGRPRTPSRSPGVEAERRAPLGAAGSWCSGGSDRARRR